MPELKPDFESFLMEIHSGQYVGPKDCMVDDFPDWLQDQDVDTLISCANAYARQYYNKAKKNE